MKHKLFRRFGAAALLALGAVCAAAPVAADTRVNIGVGVGYTWGGYGGYGYGGGYGHRHYNYYRRPPNIYYPPPAVVYPSPPPDVVYVVPNAPAEVQRADRTYCREYTTQTTIAGKRQQTYGTACRQPDGSWRIIN
ncbi:MAG TPA: hypothetical protein PKZ97_13080 [Azospirillaceae bacterium]|nr:hypothetical protein [Azospirillaceae bacterium]HRQ82038.1 hypothetical protein [Azospirillaceae bacterium]